MSEYLLNSVKERYGAIAASTLSGGDAGVRSIAEAFGYSAEELAAIPEQANMGLSCGNPTATAHLKPGEVVVDLGSGGGLDVFLAAQKVGPSGRVIGIDMTPEMIARAQQNAKSSGYENVAFHLATIDKLPLADASVDCVLSNCVINLAPDKPAVFREIFRVLKPGGRLAVSDIALKGELPKEIASNLAAYTGCIAGAIPISQYREALLAAGFAHVATIANGTDLNAYAKAEIQSSCCSGTAQVAASTNAPTGSCCSQQKEPSQSELQKLLSRYDVNAVAASFKIYALKPETGNALNPAAGGV